MRATQALTGTLPLEMAQMVKDKVASGEYASESDVVRDGLRTLADRDAAIEKWLVEEVVPALDALDADPSRAIPADEAWRRIEAHMNAQSSKKRGE